MKDVHKCYNSTPTSTTVEINYFSKLYFHYSLLISCLSETISLEEKEKKRKEMWEATINLYFALNYKLDFFFFFLEY